jgi:bifunctional non-homologous end joining protein LigD
MALETYRSKRRFDKTPEPAGQRRTSPGLPRFVVQEHRATQLHFDFRLEIDGVLVSWAVPKGPSALPSDRRLAAKVEDHPLEYGSFEGIIPAGNYGAGRVIVWDTGEYAPVPEPKGSDPVTEPRAARTLIRDQLEKGEIKIEMYGHKLRGRWALVRTHMDGEAKNWLLIKDRDEYASKVSGPPGDDRSVLSGRSLDDVIHPAPVNADPNEIDAALNALKGTSDGVTLEFSSGTVKLSHLNKEYWPKVGRQRPVAKREYIAYLLVMAPHLLRHLADRPLTLTRYPDGALTKGFYQKDLPDSAPDYVESVPLYSGVRTGDLRYALGNNLATLIWLGQMAAIELHPWLSRVTPPEQGEKQFSTNASGSEEAIEQSALNYPDFLLFDIDPYVYSGKEEAGEEPALNRSGFKRGVEAAFAIKKLLDHMALTSFVKTSGKTGLHIHVPIKRQFTFTEVRAIVGTFSEQLASQFPDRFTTVWQVERRRGLIFLDKNQNVRGKNMAAIYCPRPVAGAPVSMPVTWDELDRIYPTDFTIRTVPDLVKERGDLWLGIHAAKVDLAAALNL